MAAMMFNQSVDAFHPTERGATVKMQFTKEMIKNFKATPIQSPHRFEKLLWGRSWREASFIAASASGSSAVAHQMASLKAVEDALDIEVSEQTIMLRTLLLYGAHLAQNLAFLFHFVTPHLMMPLHVDPIIEHPDMLDELIRDAERIAADIRDTLGGHMTYPMTCVPGGFAIVPAPFKLCAIMKRIDKELLPTLVQLSKLFAPLKHKFPTMKEHRDFISLTASREYPLYEGRITASDGKLMTIFDYQEMAEKNLKSIKSRGNNGDGNGRERAGKRPKYMVGPLARIKNNQKFLGGYAMKTAAELDFESNVHNPYWSSIARLVESLQCAEKASELIERILERGLCKEEPFLPRYMANKSTGIGCTEASNGLVYHEYKFDGRGRILSARCISPINQNLPVVTNDIRHLLSTMQKDGKGPGEVAFWLDVLVRSCDTSITYKKGVKG